MQRHMAWLLVITGLCFLSLQAVAQVTFTMNDAGTGAPRTFTNSLGTASYTNGTCVVFEGQLDASLNVTNAYNAFNNKYLASVQLLVELKLFDELPAAGDVGTNVQGAVAALRDSVGSSNGTYYVWGSTNAVPMTWLKLTNDTHTAFSVREGDTNYISFVFSYPLSGSATYQVFLGDAADQDRYASAPVTSLTLSNGISSVSLLGAGVVQSVGTASGSPSPLSSAISLSVYYASNSVCADVYTVNEKGTNPIKLYAWINGSWVLVGTVNSVFGDGDSHKYHILLSGLVAGQSYLFKVEDEVGHIFEMASPLQVETITVDRAIMELSMQMLNVTFNTEPGRNYQVKVNQDLAAPANQWTVEDVSQYKGSSWGALTNVFMAGGTQTNIRIPVNKTKAFFKIYMLEE